MIGKFIDCIVASLSDILTIQLNTCLILTKFPTNPFYNLCQPMMPAKPFNLLESGLEVTAVWRKCVQSVVGKCRR